MPRYLNCFTDYLSKNNNGEMKEFLLGDYITYADIMLFDVLERTSEIFPDLISQYHYIESSTGYCITVTVQHHVTAVELLLMEYHN